MISSPSHARAIATVQRDRARERRVFWSRDPVVDYAIDDEWTDHFAARRGGAFDGIVMGVALAIPLWMLFGLVVWVIVR